MPGRCLWTLLLASATLIVTVVLAMVSPPRVAHPVEGDPRDPIIAFEMVTNVQELAAVIGERRADHAELRDAFDRLNRIDFVFIVVYGLFIAAYFLCVAQVRGERGWLAGVLLALVAALADVRENIALLALTQEGADARPHIAALMVATWVKWFALGLASLLAGLAMWATRPMRALRWVGAAAGALTLGLTAAAFVDQVRFPQAMALAIGACWVLMAVHAVRLGRADTRHPVR